MNGSVQYRNKTALESRVLFDNETQELVLLRRRLPFSQDAVVDCETASALLMARDVGELIEAADALGPLGIDSHSDDIDDFEGELTAQDVAAFLMGGHPRLSEPTPAQLLVPYFDPGVGLVWKDGCDNLLFVPQGRPRKAAAERCAGAYGCVDRGFLAEGAVFVVERVRDWEFLRNLFSVTMRFVAKGAEGCALPLTAAGFAGESWLLGPDEILDGRIMRFSIPVESFNGNPQEVDAEMPPLSLWGKDSWRRRESIDFAAIRDVETGWRESDPCRYIYAMLFSWPDESREDAEARAANSILNCFDELWGGRRAIDLGSGERGRELREVADPNGPGGAMWELLRDHPGQRILVCERCGRVRYTRLGGREARWCCDSCRVLAQKDKASR